MTDAPTPGCTPAEGWTLDAEPGSTYQQAAAWVLAHLAPAGAACLVVGSPPGEARALAAQGWAVTYLDWRTPPPLPGVTAVQGDAAALPFPAAAFDAIASTCVWCHVGLGRYGDPCRPGARATMLAEAARVLRPGGVWVGMPGPVAAGPPTDVGTVHHVTTPAAFAAAAAAAGFQPPTLRVWHEGLGQWQAATAPLPPLARIPVAYLCAAMAT